MSENTLVQGIKDINDINLGEEELKQIIIQLTYDYSEEYFEIKKVNSINTDLWAALHIGFVSALTLMGYDKDLVLSAAEKAIDELNK